MRKNLPKLSFVLFSALLFVLVGVWTESRSDISDREETAVVSEMEQVIEVSKESSLPTFLTTFFPDTDFSSADPSLYNLISGGPPKDGIPALENPEFVQVDSFEHGDDVQAVVVFGKNKTKVYPFNILTWHEIVNDEIDDKPIAITFCPLCGSAIVYDRRLPGGETTFGVSGGLIESNMVMYDRATESLWQQSTGEALAGVYKDEVLGLFPFQLLTMGEVKDKYPEAQLLSEVTGYRRDYGRNPYSGYEDDNDRFVFNIGEFSHAHEAKEIMVVFRYNNIPVATVWNDLQEGVKTVTVEGESITMSKEDGELSIKNESGVEIPFYFEMWFSFIIQHGDDAVVI